MISASCTLVHRTLRNGAVSRFARFNPASLTFLPGCSTVPVAEGGHVLDQQVLGSNRARESRRRLVDVVPVPVGNLAVPAGERFLCLLGSLRALATQRLGQFRLPAVMASASVFNRRSLSKAAYSSGAGKAWRTSRPPNPGRLCCHTADTVRTQRQGTQTIDPNFKEFARKIYCTPVFWSRRYCIISGGAVAVPGARHRTRLRAAPLSSPTKPSAPAVGTGAQIG